VDTLNSGVTLSANSSIASSNGKYTLVMQGDGNLVLYAFGNQAVWDTGTWQLPVEHRPDRAVMQPDGNLVLLTPGGVPVWATHTEGNGGSRLVLGDDRNLVIYRSDGNAVWSSNTVYAPGAVVTISKLNENVGYAKTMSTVGTLYRSGQAVCSVYTKNDNWTGGLRGKVLLLVVDEGGHAIWVSREFAAATRCSVPDPACASYGQETFRDDFPEAVGRYGARVDVYQADTPSYRDLRNELIDGIKAAGDIAQEVKDVLGQLTKS
jgi:hypothetical protein